MNPVLKLVTVGDTTRIELLNENGVPFAWGDMSAQVLERAASRDFMFHIQLYRYPGDLPRIKVDTAYDHRDSNHITVERNTRNAT